LNFPKEDLLHKNIFIDLSQLRFAELSAIVQLTLIIEGLIKNQNRLFIALPTKSYTTREEQSENYTNEKLKKSILDQRISVNTFLQNVGFTKVISEISIFHSNQVHFTKTYNFEKEFKIEPFQESFEVQQNPKIIDYVNYNVLVPLIWLDCQTGSKSFEKIEDSIDKILGNPDRGLDSIDIQGIKNVIVSELIKNVNEHSQTTHAVLAIGLINSKSLIGTKKNKKYNPIESEYLDWLSENEVKSQVEIYFGDSGVGMFTKEFVGKYQSETQKITIKEEEILRWSFQKWSTIKNNEPRRGTKGLYRIQRIINKYNGIFHISTSSHNGGFRKGGLMSEDWVYRKSKFSFNGTFIQIKLCPFSEIKEFRFSLTDNQTSKKWKVIEYTPHAANDTKVLASFKSEIRRNENLLIILNVKNLKDIEARSYLEKNLIEFSFESHPCGVVIYLLSNLQNDTTRIIVDSSNENILQRVGKDIFQEVSTRDSEEVYDPVLVIGESNEAFWFGGSQELINILDESYQNSENNVKLSDLKSYHNLPEQTQTRIRIHLEHDNKLVIYKNDQFLFNFSYLVDSISKDVHTLILKSELTNRDIEVCSPKLELVENWIDLDKLIDSHEFGFAFALYLKYKTYLLNHDINHIDVDNTFILTDHKHQKDLIKAFAKLLGVKNKHIKVASEDINTNIPKRTKLFPENSNVIVITSIISSSETVRRLVKYVKRDSANPIVVLCICNTRKYDVNKLTTWEEETDILSIYQKKITEIEKKDKDYNYFKNKNKLLSNPIIKFRSPNFKEEEKLKDLNYGINPHLRTHIIEEKALYFHHIGIYSDRHFTFYLDKEKILKKQSIIWKNLEDSILKWLKGNNIAAKNLNIYIPKNLIGTNNALPDYLKSRITRNVTSDIPTSITQANVVYIDFGVISGKSINNVIKTSNNVENLLICVLFDQTKNNDFDFYRKISSITTGNQWLEGNPTKTNITIESLFQMPLGYYTSESCPICEHSKTLDTYKLNQSYMAKFAEDRQERLKLIETDEITNSEYPFDFYYTREEQSNEISTELVVKMFELKTLLEKAETSTQFRIELYKYIFIIYENFDSNLSNSNSNLYALLYYLSNEINCLQKEPLVFRDIRVLLTEIAYKVATIDFFKFIEILNLANFTEMSTSEKLVVRYKYAAISLLRSANKLKFCQSVSEIFKSSYNGKFMSNNLAQNTFYHTNSLFYNKYNKSKSYFEAIKTQFKEFRILNLELSIEQKVTIEKIENLNQFALKSLELSSIKSDKELIKLLKKEKSYHYDSSHHPQPQNALGSINLQSFSKDGLEDIELLKEESDFYKIFELGVSEIRNNWRPVSYFLDATILPYISKFSDNLLKSNTFFSIYYLQEITSLLEDKRQGGILEEFSSLVNKVYIDPLNYFSVRSRYDYLHQLLYNKIIKQDSQFFEFLSQFPTDLKQIITAKIIPSFPQNELRCSVINPLVFYPNVKLSDDIFLIKHNIHKRLNSDKKTGKYNDKIYENVKLIIEITEIQEGIEMKISYDSTDKNNEEITREGGLFDIKSEMNRFGGSLLFETHTDTSGFFNLTFTFQKYE
jgi:hypothetical protein